jgi:uncharacterized protein (TIGR03435 family)
MNNHNIKDKLPSRKRLMVALITGDFILISIVFIISGCAKELSSAPDISIKKSYHSYGGWGGFFRGKITCERQTIPDFIQRNKNHSFRVISSVDLSQEYDIIIYADSYDDIMPKFLKSIEAIFGLSVQKETRRISVYVLMKSKASPLKIETSVSQDKDTKYSYWPVEMCKHLYQLDTYLDIFKPYEPTHHSFKNYTMADLAFWMEEQLHTAVVDETALEGLYNFELIEDSKKCISLLDSLSNLGFEVKEEVRPIEAIYVDRSPGIEPPVKLKDCEVMFDFYPAWERRE